MSTENKQKVSFHYIKNNDFRTVFASGLIGGITGQGLINMDIYTDRVVIPRKTYADINPNGSITDLPAENEAKDGVIREVQFGIVMDVDTAKSIVLWIQNNIALIEGIKNEQPK